MSGPQTTGDGVGPRDPAWTGAFRHVDDRRTAESDLAGTARTFALVTLIASIGGWGPVLIPVALVLVYLAHREIKRAQGTLTGEVQVRDAVNFIIGAVVITAGEIAILAFVFSQIS